MSGKYYLAGILLTAAALVATVLAYPHLPDSIVTHWDFRSQPDSYSPKWALFLIGPGLMAGVMLLMYFLPWLSPKNFGVETFRTTYLQVMLILVCLMAYVYAVTLWSGLGHLLHVGRAVVGGVCLLFALLGNLMGRYAEISSSALELREPWPTSEFGMPRIASPRRRSSPAVCWAWRSPLRA
jgi:uncharacterized membrane protein